MACSSCKRKKRRQQQQNSPVNNVVNRTVAPNERRALMARCMNCTGVMQSINGMVYPLVSGDFYALEERDIVRWVGMGFEFAYQNPEDAEYMTSKYPAG